MNTPRHDAIMPHTEEPSELRRVVVLLAIVSTCFTIILGGIAGVERIRTGQVAAMRAEHRRALANQKAFSAAVRERIEAHRRADHRPN